MGTDLYPTDLYPSAGYPLAETVAQNLGRYQKPGTGSMAIGGVHPRHN